MANFQVCPYVYSWLLSQIRSFFTRLAFVYPIGLLLSFCTLQTFCQEISIKQIELEAKDVFIYYTLIDSTPGRSYVVNLYTSKDNFVYPVQKATGDIGIEIKPGNNKSICWHASEELGRNYEGKITFEIRSKIYVPFLTLKNFNYKKFKRGTNYEITWSGGRPQTILNIDLYRDGNRVTTFSNIANQGHYMLAFPGNVKPGDGYQLIIGDLKNKDEIVKTHTFSITRKVPWLLKIAPVVMLGAGAYLMWGNSVDPHKDDIPYFPTPQ